jgi:uncharacterized protein (DUF1330 family)
MAAYAIFIRDALIDPAAMQTYSQLAKAARGNHSFKPLAAYGDVVTLEGESSDGVVLLEFENMAAARAWYENPEYQAAIRHRHKAANYRVILADGI